MKRMQDWLTRIHSDRYQWIAGDEPPKKKGTDRVGRVIPSTAPHQHWFGDFKELFHVIPLSWAVKHVKPPEDDVLVDLGCWPTMSSFYLSGNGCSNRECVILFNPENRCWAELMSVNGWSVSWPNHVVEQNLTSLRGKTMIWLVVRNMFYFSIYWE